MSHSYIDRSSQNGLSQSNESNQPQRKIDPVAQLKALNDNRVRDLGLFDDPPAQLFARDEEEEKTQAKKEDDTLQKKAISQDGKEQSGGSGTKTNLPNDVKSKMENSFGTDFSGVDIHTNSGQATYMGALAYTQGNDVHFAPGQYNPGSQQGQELIGHELTHVVQQREGRVAPTKQGKGLPVNDNPALEKEADEMGAKAASGQPANDIAVQQKIDPISLKEDEDIKGEIGLKNGTATKTGNKIKVGGETAGGEAIREVEYANQTSYNKSEQQIEELKATASTHAFFEFVAHNLAYKDESYKPTDDVKLLINGSGYSEDVEIKKGLLGFQYVYLKNISGEKNDIIGFRGTNPGIKPSDIATIYADTDPESVGIQQFNYNKAMIMDLLSKSKTGKVDITGHSLGGAVAQIVTANYASKVGNLYTFQAPGISAADVKKYEKTAPANRPNVYHHVAVGDMVDKAGEKNIPGNTYVHDFGIDWIKTQDLISISSSKLVEIGKSFSGIASEAQSIKKNTLKGLLESTVTTMVPLLNLLMKKKGFTDMLKDIDDLKGHVVDGIKSGKELIELVKKVGASVGEAHLKFLFSSENFKSDRKDASIPDNVYSKTNESSVVTAHQSYPFQDERPYAEGVRDAVGSEIKSALSPMQLILICESIEAVVDTLVLLRDSLVKMGELIAQAAVSTWDAITSIPGKLKIAMADFCVQLERFIYSQYRIPKF